MWLRLQPYAPRLQPHVAETATRRAAGWNSRLEWLLLMPRAHAATILRTANLFETCTPKQPSCCSISRSEDLLEECHTGLEPHTSRQGPRQACYLHVRDLPWTARAARRRRVRGGALRHL
jgi:hypothetical protein